MSYQNNGKTILVARSGYSGVGSSALGATGNCGADQEYDAKCVYMGITGQCVPRGMVGKQPGCDYSASSPSTIDKIGDFLGGLIKGATNSYATAAGTKPAQTTIVQSSMPSWAIPAAIGGVGLLAVIMMTRPRSNPARRRRRR